MIKKLSDLKPSEILSDPSASFWLKEALKKSLERDPIDAANDAEALAQILRGHAARVLRGER